MADVLSAAEAVLDAAYKRMDENPRNEVEAILAAALRAAADQLTPYSVSEMEGAALARDKLLAIATELEGQ